MASIIRSPQFSDEKRKLTSRRGRASTAAAVASAFPAAPVAEAVPSPVEPHSARAPAPAPLAPAAAVPAAKPGPSQAEVAALVEQARQSVLEQFKAEGEKARELGRQRGLQEGREAGTEEARKSFEAELARVRGIAGQLEQAMASGIQGTEEIAVAIAFEAVCKLMGRSAVTREGILALVQQACSHAVQSETLVVRLHPADLATLRSAGALDTALSSTGKLSWIADATVVLGGCVLETDGGELDARLETQLDRLRLALRSARDAV